MAASTHSLCICGEFIQATTDKKQVLRFLHTHARTHSSNSNGSNNNPSYALGPKKVAVREMLEPDQDGGGGAEARS